MLPKCSHGAAADDMRYIGVWNAPFSRCLCCGISFPYIDSAQFTPGKGLVASSTWTPKNLCGICGGRYVEYAQIQDES